WHALYSARRRRRREHRGPWRTGDPRGASLSRSHWQRPASGRRPARRLLPLSRGQRASVQRQQRPAQAEPAGAFKATGGWVVIMAFLHHWKDLCKAMGRPELVDDAKLGTDTGRLANRAELIKLLEDWLATFPDRDSAVDHMQKHGVPVAPVLSIEETVSHPHLRARGTVRTIEDRFA